MSALALAYPFRLREGFFHVLSFLYEHRLFHVKTGCSPEIFSQAISGEMPPWHA